MASNRTSDITIAGTTFALQMVNGVRQFHVQRDTWDPSTVQPFYEFVPFGTDGMGGSTAGIARNQHHYSLDVGMEPFDDRLWVGLAQNTVTLGLTNITCITDTYLDSSNNRYVLIGNDSAALPKIRLDTMASTGTKTFTGGTPVLSHVLVVKAGQLAGITDRYGAQIGSGIVKSGFAVSCTIYQLDTVGTNAVDTWSTNGTPTAYGGFFGLTQGTNNAETRIWKSSGQSGSGFANGPFSRIQYLAVSTSTSPVLDYSVHTNWLGPSGSGTAYQVGDQGSSINGLLEFLRGLAVAKPEGVYGFDASGNQYPMFGTRSYISTLTGRNLAAWGTTLLIETKMDLMSSRGGAGAAIGVTKLASNTSPVMGYPSAVCVYGDFIYVAYYDGTDTYIVRLYPRDGQNVRNPYLIYPITKLASKRCLAMRVVERANGDQVLLYGKGADLGWCILDPVASRVYQSGGLWYSPRFGEPGRPYVLDSVTMFTAGCTASITAALAVDNDESGSYTTLGTYTTNGNHVQAFTPGTADSGTFARFRITLTTNTTTKAPIVMGGGLYLRGNYTGAHFDRLTVRVILGTHSSSGIGADEMTTYNTLKAAQGTETTMIYSDFWGDSSQHKIYLEEVGYDEGVGDGAMAAERFGVLKFRTLAGTS